MTGHSVYYKNSNSMSEVKSGSIDLIVTSPPYPMIAMWDEIFSKQNPQISDALNKKDGTRAFELMHQQLDIVWQECFRVLKNGGILCINIGDATRTIDGNFQLFSSHSRIISFCLKTGFQNLPNIIWRKPTNSPTKFMGSGMLPPGAYVTLEHEYILVFRKGSLRKFNKDSEKQLRQESAFFWEERNLWFSDIWFDLKGTEQNLNKKDLRKRSAAYPFELVYRLINMFSIKNDMVLDPFMGTGTSMAAAMCAERNSVGYELDINFKPIIDLWKDKIIKFSNDYIYQRLKKHLHFVNQQIEKGKKFKHINSVYNFPCKSRQESKIFIKNLKNIETDETVKYAITYENEPQKEFCDRDEYTEIKNFLKHSNLQKNDKYLELL